MLKAAGKLVTSAFIVPEPLIHAVEELMLQLTMSPLASAADT